MTTPEELDRDPMYDQAVGLLVLTGKASTSFLQRRLNLGYNAAARLMERAEDEGIVSRPNHVGKRDVLISAALRARVAELEGRERMIVSHATGGANDGATMTVNEIAVEITKARNLAFIAGKTAAEAELARRGQGVQVKQDSQGESEVLE